MKRNTKLKNTAIIFELLTADLVSNLIDNKASNSNEIIREHFKKGSELAKELTLYRSLVETVKSNHDAERLLDIVIKQHNGLNEIKLKKARYNLVKSILEKYEKDFFKNRVQNYKVYNSIYNLFEHNKNNSLKPIDELNCKNTIIEHLVKDKTKVETINEEMTVFNSLDKATRLIAFKKITEKFNDKYSKVLTESQKTLINNYIVDFQNISKFKTYLNEEIDTIINAINKTTINENQIQTKVKLDVLKNTLKGIKNKPLLKDNDVEIVLNSYNVPNLISNLK